MIKITIPNNNQVERKYILDVIFKEFLDLEYKIVVDVTSKYWKITLNNGTKIMCEDHFFNKYKNDLEYLDIDNIPSRVKFTSNQFISEENIPIIFGTSLFSIQNQTIKCGIDIFASCFFMLTRWEEYVIKARDIHDRFPAAESFADKHGFLDRPIVNEYLVMLKSMLLYLDSTLSLKHHIYKTDVSCDIDSPFDCTVKNIGSVLRACTGDLIKRKSITQFVKRFRRYWANKRCDYRFDENYTFEWYMDVCETMDLKASFYFIPDNHEKNNGCYSLKDLNIQKLIILINARGHELGVHSSYQTYKDPDKMQRQKDLFVHTLKELHIYQELRGNRQHYLRFDAAQTPTFLEDAGFEYDSTGGYADKAGFRYGVCYEFSMFDFINQRPLHIKQRPLILMECSIIDEKYMGLGYTQKALDMMNQLKRHCIKYDGIFSLLWHNSHLKSNEDRAFFQSLLQESKYVR